MSEIIKDEFKILVRYVYDDPNDPDKEGPEIVSWLCAEITGQNREHYVKRSYWLDDDMEYAYEWVSDYGDRHKALDMAGRLMKIVKVGVDLIARGYVAELVLVRDTTHRTITPLNEANAMVVLAVAAL